MVTRFVSSLAAIARPTLVAAGVLLATGSVAAVFGVAAGWVGYLAGFAGTALAIAAVGAVHASHVGRLAAAVFALATVNILMAAPVVAMITAFMLGFGQVGSALMPYATSTIGVTMALGVNVSLALVGIVIARAGLLPARAGWLIVGAAALEWPVEFGLFPSTVWAAAMVVLAAAFIGLARGVKTDDADSDSDGGSDASHGRGSSDADRQTRRPTPLRRPSADPLSMHIALPRWS